MRKIAVVLSGCGFKDGAEITESVATLIALSEHPVQVQMFAPNMDFHSVNHLNGESSGTRNVLIEAARIARGKILDLEDLESQKFDAVIFPGGYGAATHLCNFAEKGSVGTVLPKVKSLILEFHRDGKPIGAFCIAPALISLVLGGKGVCVTIGNDSQTALEITKTGAEHEITPVTEFISDRENKVVTTPAYMYDDATPFEVYNGIKNAVKEIVEMA